MPVLRSRNNPRVEETCISNMEPEGAVAGLADFESLDADALDFKYDTNDEKILKATMKAFESGSLMPLIKEELRCTIQSRRLAEGKGELTVEFKSPPKKKEMTKEERERYLKRRVQNREAAQRFRQKQKDTSDKLTAKIQRLERNSKILLADLSKLREEKNSLREMLKNHLVVCTNQHRIPSILSQNQLERLLGEPASRTQAPSTCSGSTSDGLSTSGSFSTSISGSYCSSPTSASLAATPSPRPGTADSSAGGSDVFFFSENDEENMNISNGANMEATVEVIVTSAGGNNHEKYQVVNDVPAGENSSHGVDGNLLHTFEFSPSQFDIEAYDVAGEEVVVDTPSSTEGLNATAFNNERHHYKNGHRSSTALDHLTVPDAHMDDDMRVRLDSCSSVDTVADARGLANSFSSELQPQACYNSFGAPSVATDDASMGTTVYYDANTQSFLPLHTNLSQHQQQQQHIINDHEMVVYASEVDPEGLRQAGRPITFTLPESFTSQLTKGHNVNSSTYDPIVLANGGNIDGYGGLAESTSDLRHSLTFAYSRVHDLCDLDSSYAAPDLLLTPDPS